MERIYDETGQTSRSRLINAGSGWIWHTLLGMLALLLMLPVCAKPEDGNTNKGELWRSVSRVHGRLTIEDRSGRNDQDAHKHYNDEDSTRIQVDFTLERVRPREEEVPAELPPQLAKLIREQIANGPKDESTGSSLSWQAISARITGAYYRTVDQASYPMKSNFTQSAEFRGVPSVLEELTLNLDTETGAWGLTSPGKLREKYQKTTTGSEFNASSNENREINEVAEVDDLVSVAFHGELSGTPGPVNGRVKVEHGGTPDNPTGWGTKIGQVEFWPEFDDVEVEVKIEGYDAWRPRGSIDQPTRPGNHLVARATLVPKDGGALQNLPRVKNFRFELIDTSREPGVCMNWPLAAKDNDYDLRLAEAQPFVGTLSNKDQGLEVTQTANDDQGRPYAQAQVDSYDFGSRAGLRVFCTLTDGREIEGVMKVAAGDENPVRLPMMKVPGWIAESWRKKNDVEKLSEIDDEEKVEGQKDNGDGFTLYEEYRGFVVDGRWIEGDPKRKDFFVLNLIGADAEPGIELFEQLSELRVHAKLEPGEMSEKTRLMNGNHLDAPRRVEQHGVWIKQFLDDPPGTKNGRTGKDKLGDSGAATSLTDKGVAGRPGLVNGIGLLARDNTESAFNQPFNLPAEDAIFAYDRAIAHELLHTVGVEHHGTGDYNEDLSYVPPNSPNNVLGRPYFSWNMTGHNPVGLLTEDGHDVATEEYLFYLKMLEQMRASIGARVSESELSIYAAGYMGKSGLVGVKHGEHSGDQDCLMRYYFAKFYEAKKPQDKTVEKTLYVVTPGTERIGMQICRTGKGTGVNASDHKPQSRYGDAASDAGNCFGQICPNDAIKPRKVKR